MFSLCFSFQASTCMSTCPGMHFFQGRVSEISCLGFSRLTLTPPSIFVTGPQVQELLLCDQGGEIATFSGLLAA